MSTIARNITKYRKALGLTQAELAAYLGKSAAAVSQYESGAIKPSMPTVRSLAATFGVRPSDLLDAEIDAPQEETALEFELLALFRQLDERDRRVLVATAKAMVAER